MAHSRYSKEVSLPFPPPRTRLPENKTLLFRISSFPDACSSNDTQSNTHWCHKAWNVWWETSSRWPHWILRSCFHVNILSNKIWGKRGSIACKCSSLTIPASIYVEKDSYKLRCQWFKKEKKEKRKEILNKWKNIIKYTSVSLTFL